MRPFEYQAPESVGEVLELLARHGSDAKILAGGQSLLVLMRQRLVSPEVLVSLSRVAELRSIEAAADGVIRIGAMTSYREAARDSAVVARATLLARAAGSVGSLHIRARGTLGGAVSHSDPAGDVPVALMALDGVVEVRGPGGMTEFAAADFPVGLFATQLPEGSIVTAVRVPRQPDAARVGYRRFLLREGEYPMTQTAVRLMPEGDRIADARVAVGGAGDRPRRIPEAEAFLSGRPLDGTMLDGFGEVVAAHVRPTADVRGDAWWKTRVIAATARRALAEAHGTPSLVGSGS